MKIGRAVLALCLMVSIATLRVAAQPAGCPSPAPLLSYPLCEQIPGEYLFLFNEGYDPTTTANSLQKKYGFTLTSIWEFALRGFAARDVTPQQLRQLRCEPSILQAEPNTIVFGPFPVGPDPCAAEIPAVEARTMAGLAIALAAIGIMASRRS